MNIEIVGFFMGLFLVLLGGHGLVTFRKGKCRHFGFLSLSILELLWGLSVSTNAVIGSQALKYFAWGICLLIVILLSTSFVMKYPAFYKKKENNFFILLGAFGFIMAGILCVLFYLNYRVYSQI